MLFDEFSVFCDEIEKISGRIEMVQRISVFLSRCDDDDLRVAVRFMMGRIFPDWSPLKIGIGPNLLYDALAYVTGRTREEVIRHINTTGDIGRSASDLLSGKVQTTFFSDPLTIIDVYRELDRIAGTGGKRSQREKGLGIRRLLANARPREGKYLCRIILEDMRIGIGEGNMREAIARAFGVSSPRVERAHQAMNDLGEVAILARLGEEALSRINIEPFRPVKMMLAQQGSIDETVAENGQMAAEYKYDGSRFQFHKKGSESRLFSRRLEDVTGALPEIREGLASATTHDVILDGEVIAVQNGRPMPFQMILRRFRRKHDIDAVKEEIALVPNVFDLLYLDGETLIDRPLIERRRLLESVLSTYAAPQVVSDQPGVIRTVYESALEAGHEGIMLKVPSSPYTPGVRGKNWVKIKPAVDTLDLVVLGADWGEGKRAHVFGSFLLGARDDNGRLNPVTRVATGFTDDQLQEMFTLLKDQVILESGKEVRFEPELVFEIGYSEIQLSPNYEGGYALRFPRFIRLREDKGVDEIDSLASIALRYQHQGAKNHHGTPS